jgi:hypothetical protein
VLVAGYVVLAFAWVIVSARWYPWEPPTTGNRILGAFAQGPVWPLALIAWAALDFETVRKP